jgi:hypothetical protein
MMAKIERTIRKADGSEIKIVAQACFGLGLKLSIDVYVLYRENPTHEWKLANDRPHPDWRKMSVDEYVKRGRSEMLRMASIGEILKTTNMLRASMAQ